MWELDARLSRDGVVVVCHDDTVTVADGRRIALARTMPRTLPVCRSSEAAACRHSKR